MNLKLTDKFISILHTQGYAERSIKTYASHLTYFLKVYNKLKIEDIPKQQIEDFILYLVEKKKVSQSYQKAMLFTITKFYKEIFYRDIDLKNLYPKRKQCKLPDFLTHNEVRRILESTGNSKHRTVLAIIYFCGLRVHEALGIKISDLNLTENTLLISQAGGNKNRIIMLSPSLLEILRTYYKNYRPQNYLFEGQYGKKYSERSVQQVFKNALHKAGIISTASVRTLRHSCAIHLLENGTDIITVKELLGHNNLKNTEIYKHIADSNKKNIKSPLDLL